MTPEDIPKKINWKILGFHPNKRIVVTPVEIGYESNTSHHLYLYDMSSGNELGILRGDGNVITALAYSPNGEWLVSSSSEGGITLWSSHTHRQIETLKGSKCHISQLLFSPDYRKLFANCSDGIIKIWDLNPAYQLLHKFNPEIVSEALQFLWEMEKDELEFKGKLRTPTLLPQTEGYYFLFTEKMKKYVSLLKHPNPNETKIEQLVRFLEENQQRTNQS